MGNSYRGIGDETLIDDVFVKLFFAPDVESTWNPPLNVISEARQDQPAVQFF
jgi:hypothetical protein